MRCGGLISSCCLRNPHGKVSNEEEKELQSKLRIFVVCFLDCYDCQLAWDRWRDCSNGTRTRSQYILIEPEGGGRDCQWEPDQVEGSHS